MNQQEKATGRRKIVLDHTSPGWDGYTLEQLVYRREVNKVKQRIIIDRLKMAADNIKRNQFSGGIFSNFNSLMSYADYAIIGYKVFSRLHRLYKSIRH